MNQITLRILAVLLLVLGIAMTAASCKGEPAETEAPAETVMAPLPTEILPPETTIPPTTEAPETEPQEERFLLTFAGDCTLGASPANYYATVGFIKTVGEDYAYPFANVIDYFENDDFTMVNLEGALCEQGTPIQKKYNFRGPTDYVNILTQNSVEAVTVANNHSMDYGRKGYATTLATLEEAGVAYVEQDSSTIVTTESGLTIGLYGMVYYSLNVETMTQAITAMKEQGVDLIIVAPHWGIEMTYNPTEEQSRVGRAAIDAGANIVYGTHPHVLQPIEEYNGGIIYYSLGNFSFGGNTAPDDFDTVLVQQEVIREPDGTVRLGELTVVPACISSISAWNNYQPTPYEPGSEDYDRVLGKLGICN